jgi:two-component system, LytTR family, response regulator
LRLADISLLKAEPNGVALHVGKQTHLLSDTLDALAAKLPPGLFLRISPRAIVNTRHIKGLRRLCQGEWQVLLRNGTRLAPHISVGQAAVLLSDRSARAIDAGR